MQRANMIRTMQTQATFAEGTHSLIDDIHQLRRVRTHVMKSLWKTEGYSANPAFTMALLCPVTMDPEFGAIYTGLCNLARYVRCPVRAALVRQRFDGHMTTHTDGPTMRLRTLAAISNFSPLITQLLQGISDENRWKHDLRETWRQT